MDTAQASLADLRCARRSGRRSSGRRKWSFRFTVAFLVPVLFFVLLEVGLRLGGYGYPTTFFIKADERDAYLTNRFFGWRFFPRAIARAPNQLSLPTPKPPGTYRIFVLGGSAARGEPDPAFSFGRILEVMLRHRFSDTKFEVVNTAMTAINSHVVHVIAKACARHEPDLFVVYLGNNEVVGPFGPGTVFVDFSPSLTMIRASLWASSTKIGQLTRYCAGVMTARESTWKKWRGMLMFANKFVSADDPRLDNVYDHFRANLEDIIRTGRKAGADVVFCTVATNLKDNAPFASEHRGNLGGDELTGWEQIYQCGIKFEDQERYLDAIEQYASAEDIDDRYADLHFRMARCRYALGHFDQAKQHFLRARDLDVLRFRADCRINQVIREVAYDRDSNRVHLVDAERAFETSERTPQHIPDQSLFYEHVHLNFDGSYLLASEVLKKIEDLLPAPVRASDRGSLPSQDQCAEALAFTGWDRCTILTNLKTLTERAPFTNQIDYAERRALRARRRSHLMEYMAADGLDQAAQAYMKAIRQKPDDLELHKKLGRLELERGNSGDAVQHWRFLIEQIPDHLSAHNNLGNALQAKGKIAEALAHYRLALQITPDSAEVHNNMGLALASQDRVDQAISSFQRALELNHDYAEAHNNLGTVLESQGKLTEAISQYRQAVEIEPYYADAYFNLAKALAMQGELDEAIEHYMDVVRLSPSDADAHKNLGIALVSTGRFDEALKSFHQTLRLRPQWPAALNALAWILATHPDAKARDSSQAIVLSERAAALTQHRDPYILSTLATAYASASQFERAVTTGEAAFYLAVQREADQLANHIRQRLELYRQGKPHVVPGATPPAIGTD